MSKYVKNQEHILVDTGEIFAEEVDTGKIQLDNFQSAKVCVKTGTGEKKSTVAKVFAVLQDGSEIEIKTQEISIGNSTETHINVVADELAHHDATEFKIKIGAIAECKIEGTVIAILGEPRYSE